MIRRIFVVAFLALMLGAGDACAQFKLGVKGGMNLTDFRLNSSVIERDNRRGFFFGPTLKIAIPLFPLGFDISALYDQRESTVDDGEQSWDVTSKQVVIPINARLTFGSSKSLAIFVFGGPQFGFAINDKQNIIDNYRSWKNEKSKFSVNMGAGFLIGDVLQLSANYNMECGKDGSVTINDVVNELKDHDSKMNAWQLTATVYF